MIALYTAPSCLSCRKVKKYFAENQIKYVERNILSTPLRRVDIMRMLESSETGVYDIISKRSKAYQDSNVNIDDMQISELIEYIIKHPTILKRPIIISDMDMQVGYNNDDISLFLPLELRDRALCMKEDCKYMKSLKIQ
ncbi:MAG: Spx/MgsR family RNA polymerase-binding regulatory protein [Bacilli bacterium]